MPAAAESYAHLFAPSVAMRKPDPTTGARLIGRFEGSADLFAIQVIYDIDWTFRDVMGEAVRG
jgi:hypothetical protein